MGSFKVVTGDLFVGVFDGQYDVIGHGLNCFNTQGAGIVIPFKKYFHTDTFPMEQSGKGDINKLGQIDFQNFCIENGQVHSKFDDNFKIGNLWVVNCYSQYHYGKNHIDGSDKPIDYEALTLCLRKINTIFKGKRIGLPAIGAGLAGGNIDIIKQIMKTELKDCDVTLVLFDKKK